MVKINFTQRFTLTWICISLRGWEEFNMSIMKSARRSESFYGCWLSEEDAQRHAQRPITLQAWKQITPNWQNYTRQILRCRIVCPLSQYGSFSFQTVTTPGFANVSDLIIGAYLKINDAKCHINILWMLGQKEFPERKPNTNGTDRTIRQDKGD